MKTKAPFKGQTLIEFALILPLMIFLLAGFLDLGRALFYYSSISNMAREGARFGIIDNNSAAGPYADMITKMNDFSFGVPDVSPVPTVPECYPGPCEFSGPDLTVNVERTIVANNGNPFFEFIIVEAVYNFTPVTPGIKELIGSSTGIELRARSRMRIAIPSR